jgi:hypothetical protein
MADLMVFMRRWARPPRSGDEGRCLRGAVEGSVGEDVRWDGVRLVVVVAVPVALAWDVADMRELADVE